MWDGHIGRINVAKQRIELLQPDTTPVHSAAHQDRSRTREFEKAKIYKTLAESIIKLVQTEWAARIVFKFKKGGTIQLCKDCRKLHTVFKRDSYSIPRVDEYIDSLSKVTVF